MTASSNITVIAGPTASGKSALAVALAERFGPDGAVVINADSMQVYKDLRVLTARPSAADEARSPHRLYGCLGAETACSAGAWADMALAEVNLALRRGRMPIVVGGTGLYLLALMRGFSPIPDVPAGIRQATRELHETLGHEGFHEQLRRWDPRAAARLQPGDRQRCIRAWEVMAATNRSIVDWQTVDRVGPPPDWRFSVFVLMPDRESLYEACDARLHLMAEGGALDEVAALERRGLDPGLPALKALGYRPLADHLAGKTSLGEAVATAQRETRNYAKRQLTWLRHQIPKQGEGGIRHVQRFSAQYSESFLPEIEKKVRISH